MEYGLLPREDFETDAAFEVVGDGANERTQLYREVTVRVGGVVTVLLVGPWFEFRDGQRCRLVGRVEDGAVRRDRDEERPVGTFVTVGFVTE